MRKNFCAVLLSAAICLIRSFFLCSTFILSFALFTLKLKHEIDLVPPESVLVELGEAVDNDGDGQGEDEDPGECAESTD